MKVYTLVLSYPHEGGNLLGVSASQKALEATVKEAMVSCFSDVSDSPNAIKEIMVDMSWSIERFVANGSGDVVYRARSSDPYEGDGCYSIQEWEVTNETSDQTAIAEGTEADKDRRSPRHSQGS